MHEIVSISYLINNMLGGGGGGEGIGTVNHITCCYQWTNNCNQLSLDCFSDHRLCLQLGATLSN